VVRVLEDAPLVAICESPSSSLVFGSSGVTSLELGSKSNGSKTCEIESTCPIKSPIHRLHIDLWELLDRTSLGDLTRPSELNPLAKLAQISNTPSE